MKRTKWILRLNRLRRLTKWKMKGHCWEDRFLPWSLQSHFLRHHRLFYCLYRLTFATSRISAMGHLFRIWIKISVITGMWCQMFYQSCRWIVLRQCYSNTHFPIQTTDKIGWQNPLRSTGQWTNQYRITVLQLDFLPLLSLWCALLLLLPQNRFH